MSAFLDKIALREQSKKLDRHIREMRDTLDSGKLAGEALLWFADYAGEERITTNDVVKVKAEMVASGTLNNLKALTYIESAIAELHPQIVARAIEMAENDFKAARELIG